MVPAAELAAGAALAPEVSAGAVVSAGDAAAELESVDEFDEELAVAGRDGQKRQYDGERCDEKTH